MEAAIRGRPASACATRTFSRRAQVQTHLEIQPVRTGRQLPIRPAVAAIELGDQCEPAIVRGVQLTGEFGDLRFQFFERHRCADFR
jgi:hypothetical protein